MEKVTSILLNQWKFQPEFDGYACRPTTYTNMSPVSISTMAVVKETLILDKEKENEDNSVRFYFFAYVHAILRDVFERETVDSEYKYELPSSLYRYNDANIPIGSCKYKSLNNYDFFTTRLDFYKTDYVKKLAGYDILLKREGYDYDTPRNIDILGRPLRIIEIPTRKAT